MAAFEFCLKDFIAQVVDRTDMYDDVIETCDWIDISKARVLSRRDSSAGIGAILIHPLLGWHEADKVNDRYERLFNHQLLESADEVRTLERLWILRHSVVHNAGFVTDHDAYRLRARSLREQGVKIDGEFISQTVDFLGDVVLRLQRPIGQGIMRRWFATRAVGTWEEDEPAYVALKHLTRAVVARTDDLPTFNQATYEKERDEAARSASEGGA
jgi:hypothetical protein